jgi:hypothetical protein
MTKFLKLSALLRMITPVKIVNKNKRTFKVTHKIPESKIFNAPDEKIKSSDIIDYYKN